jgi:hypothetical protein
MSSFLKPKFYSRHAQAQFRVSDHDIIYPASFKYTAYSYVYTLSTHFVAKNRIKPVSSPQSMILPEQEPLQIAAPTNTIDCI